MVSTPGEGVFRAHFLIRFSCYLGAWNKLQNERLLVTRSSRYNRICILCSLAEVWLYSYLKKIGKDGNVTVKQTEEIQKLIWWGLPQGVILPHPSSHKALPHVNMYHCLSHDLCLHQPLTAFCQGKHQLKYLTTNMQFSKLLYFRSAIRNTISIYSIMGVCTVQCNTTSYRSILKITERQKSKSCQFGEVFAAWGK